MRVPRWNPSGRKRASLDPAKVKILGIGEDLNSNHIFRLTNVLTKHIVLPATITPIETTIWPSSGHSTMTKILLDALKYDWLYELGEPLRVQPDQLERLESAMFLMAFQGWDAEIIDAEGNRFFRSHDEFWHVELNSGHLAGLLETLEKLDFDV